jgi:hypothetical protein
MSNILHIILAQNSFKKDVQGKPLRRRFTLTAWNAIPSMFHGKNKVPKQGWVQVTESIPEEAAAIINTKVTESISEEAAAIINTKVTESISEEAAAITPLEKMKGAELLEYIAKNGIEIENAESLTKSQLINEIRKVSAHN